MNNTWSFSLSLCFRFYYSLHLASPTRLFLAHVLSIPPVPTGVYPLQPPLYPPFNPVSPGCSRLAPQYNMLIPLRGNFATLRVTNFSAVIPSCFLFCYLWVLLFWCFCNDTICALLEIHDVTWAIRLIGALWVFNFLLFHRIFSPCLINPIGV